MYYMAEPSTFGATLNLGHFRFLSISHSREMLELLFSTELKTTCLHLNIVYKMFLIYNLEKHLKHFYQHISLLNRSLA